MIKSATIQNFMGYDIFEAKKFAPINIIIGKNDTGKTALLKLLYASCMTIDVFGKRIQNEDISLKKILSEKLIDIYQPGKKGLGELVNKITKKKLEVDIEFDNGKLNYKDRLHFSFGEDTTHTINDCQKDIKSISDNFRCIFIPAKEVLTSFKAIRATRDNLHMLGFDDTYLDLIRALVIPTQKGNVTNELTMVNKKLEALFEGHIEHTTDDDFIFRRGRAEFPMQLTAEGIKKIGLLTTLIRNRQLNANSVLFLDEPETALHPGAARELIEMLVLMAKAGVQIFISSHSYFILKQLHICSKREILETNCYMLSREIGKSIGVKTVNLKEEFPDNDISEEGIKMSEEEIKLDLGL